MAKKLTIQERIERLRNHYYTTANALNEQYVMDMHNLLREWELEQNKPFAKDLNSSSS